MLLTNLKETHPHTHTHICVESVKGKITCTYIHGINVLREKSQTQKSHSLTLTHTYMSCVYI